LTGFKSASGEYISTEFREAFEKGGLFLFDEIDASYPQAVLAFNAALANDYMDFPDKRILRHKDFYCIAAANTFGQGADRQYIGRNQP
jgi:MoxR-like ATPase